MIIGIGLTSIDFFSRSPSRILDPSRVSVTNPETLIFDNWLDTALIPQPDFETQEGQDNPENNIHDKVK
jgi:hypothetical protein